MEIDFLREMTFSEVLEFSFKKKLPDWEKKSRSDYKSTKKYFLEASIMLGIDNRKIVELRCPHYITLLEKAAAIRRLGAKGTINIANIYLHF
ncbi:MAG: hypothetical protein PW786_05180 [Arachidicoccus sp.]|nr:hypothetical protein [Arachidicoccus sp.]